MRSDDKPITGQPHPKNFSDLLDQTPQPTEVDAEPDTRHFARVRTAWNRHLVLLLIGAFLGWQLSSGSSGADPQPAKPCPTHTAPSPSTSVRPLPGLIHSP